MHVTGHNVQYKSTVSRLAYKETLQKSVYEYIIYERKTQY